MHTVKWRWRDTGEPFEAVLSDQEYAWLRRQYERAKALPVCPERTDVLMETAAIMEMKAAFPGSELVLGELPPSVASLEARGFSIPRAAKEQMLGQLPLDGDGAS